MTETPLTLACATKKSREVILTLVAAGAHIDFRNKEGYTPMHRAASMGHTDTILVSCLMISKVFIKIAGIFDSHGFLNTEIND